MPVLMGRFLFHCVQEASIDGWLHPLNVLKGKHPDLYTQHARKYEGREYVMEKRIPIFDCLWNDVLFLSAINPLEVVQALKHVGGNPPPLKYYLITDRAIEFDKCLVYLYEHEDHEDPSQYVPYKPEMITRFASMPDKTLDYYREAISKGERPLLYRYVPHFLYRGSIYVGNSNLMTAEAVDLDSS